MLAEECWFFFGGLKPSDKQLPTWLQIPSAEKWYLVRFSIRNRQHVLIRLLLLGQSF